MKVKKVLFFSLIMVLAGLFVCAPIVSAIPRDSTDYDHEWLKPPKDFWKWKYISPVVTQEDRDRGFVIVQRGWTLAGIAKAMWGDWRKYPKLKEYTGISSDTIHVGQKIWLRPKVVLTEDEKMAVARVVVWKRMKSCFYYRTRIKDYPVTATREWAHDPLKMVNYSTNRLDMKQYFREVMRRMDWVDVLEMYHTMIEIAKDSDDLLRLAGVMWQESSFKMVPGKHGEIGALQILPSTGLEILKKNPDLVPDGIDIEFLTVDDVRNMLKDVSLNVRMGHKHLRGLLVTTKDGTKALRRYNGRGPETIVYAKRVRNRIKSLTNDWNKEISNLFEEKLKEAE